MNFWSEMYLTILYKGVFITLSNIKMELFAKIFNGYQLKTNTYFRKQLGSPSKSGRPKSFYRYCFGRCFSELALMVPRPFSGGRSTRYSDRLHVNSFFPRTARLWNSLLIECFPLTYDLNGFKFRVNRHLLIVGSF